MKRSNLQTTARATVLTMMREMDTIARRGHSRQHRTGSLFTAANAGDVQPFTSAVAVDPE